MTKVYEQVDQSGLYRLAGECRQGRFIKATGHMPLRTMAQWQAQARDVQPKAPAERTRAGVMSFDPPRTFDRIIALRQEPHAVAETTRHPVRERPLTRPPARQTYPQPHDLLGKVLVIQAQRGWRPAPATPLHTMAAHPCERCGRATCGCPPPAPRVLEAAVAQQRCELDRREEAFDAAGYVRLVGKG